jgi:hypothetical protein
MHKQVHTMAVPESDFWAKIEETDGAFYIVDGWNIGQITAAIPFPNLSTARWMLAGRWNVLYGLINLVSSEEVLPELTTEEKIVKVAKQLARGMILTSEFEAQMDRIMAESMNKVGQQMFGTEI